VNKQLSFDYRDKEDAKQEGIFDLGFSGFDINASSNNAIHINADGTLPDGFDWE